MDNVNNGIRLLNINQTPNENHNQNQRPNENINHDQAPVNPIQLQLGHLDNDNNDNNEDDTEENAENRETRRRNDRILDDVLMDDNHDDNQDDNLNENLDTDSNLNLKSKKKKNDLIDENEDSFSDTTEDDDNDLRMLNIKIKKNKKKKKKKNKKNNKNDECVLCCKDSSRYIPAVEKWKEIDAEILSKIADDNIETGIENAYEKYNELIEWCVEEKKMGHYRGKEVYPILSKDDIKTHMFNHSNNKFLQNIKDTNLYSYLIKNLLRYNLKIIKKNKKGHRKVKIDNKVALDIGKLTLMKDQLQKRSKPLFQEYLKETGLKKWLNDSTKFIRNRNK
jgi:hypothetical protein